MLVENQTVLMTWSTSNKKRYISKGYEFTFIGDKFPVCLDDLPDGSHVKVDVLCDYCGSIVSVAWRDYIRCKYDKYACKKCRQKRTSEYNLSERQDYLYNGALKTCEENGYTLLTRKEDIKTAESRVEYACNKHGVNETKVYTLLLGHGCPGCAYESNGNNAKLSIDFVDKRIRECGGIWLNKDEYVGWNVKNLIIKCPSCGEPFTTSYNSFTHRGGQFCDNCTKTRSIGENIIEGYLSEHDIPFEREHRFNDCRDVQTLPFDFYLPDYNIAIEYQGKQHYEPVVYFGGEDHFNMQKKHDDIKRNYCADNGIYLLEIPYWDFDSIDEILDETFNLHKDIV